MYDQQIQGGMGMRIPMSEFLFRMADYMSIWSRYAATKVANVPGDRRRDDDLPWWSGSNGRSAGKSCSNTVRVYFIITNLFLSSIRRRIPSQSSIGQSPGQIPQMYMVNPNQMAQQSRAGMQPMPVNQAYIQQQQQPQFTQQQSNQLVICPAY
jgi:hypothetical protein